MATKTVAAKPEPVGTAMLEQLADLDAKSISPETARKFLDLAFSRLQQERVHALSQKAREGSLTPGLTHHNSESGLAGKPCLLVKSKLLDHIFATFR